MINTTTLSPRPPLTETFQYLLSLEYGRTIKLTLNNLLLILFAMKNSPFIHAVLVQSSPSHICKHRKGWPYVLAKDFLLRRIQTYRCSLFTF